MQQPICSAFHTVSTKRTQGPTQRNPKRGKSRGAVHPEISSRHVRHCRRKARDGMPHGLLRKRASRLLHEPSWPAQRVPWTRRKERISERVLLFLSRTRCLKLSPMPRAVRIGFLPRRRFRGVGLVLFDFPHGQRRSCFGRTMRGFPCSRSAGGCRRSPCFAAPADGALVPLPLE